MKQKMIIGIHGLANKPEKQTLSDWWLASINEGLKWAGRDEVVAPEQFCLFYWADSMYVKPRSQNETLDSPFCLKEPYAPVESKPPAYRSSWPERFNIRFAKAVNDFFYKHHFTRFLNILARPIVAITMKELDIYTDPTRRFNGPHTAAAYLTAALHETLAAHQDKSILLMAHSMGSLIAYETLRRFPDVSVDLFVTIGSPLSQLGFKRGLLQSQKGFPNCHWPVITDNIHAWKNFIDWDDPVIMRSLVTLREYYKRPDGSQIVDDFLVDNAFTFQNEDGELERDHHKVYGYLRCPEVSNAIQTFMTTLCE